MDKTTKGFRANLPYYLLSDHKTTNQIPPLLLPNSAPTNIQPCTPCCNTNSPLLPNPPSQPYPHFPQPVPLFLNLAPPFLCKLSVPTAPPNLKPCSPCSQPCALPLIIKLSIKSSNTF